MRILPNASRVITKPFFPGGEVVAGGLSRNAGAVARVLALAEADVITTLEDTLAAFSHRHRHFDAVLDDSFSRLAAQCDIPAGISPQRMRLLGAYFTHEYSIEATALGNPSIVIGPDQSGLGPGEARFVMSLRAIGEGHLSCIEFRSGVIDATAAVTLDAPTRFASTGRRGERLYERAFFATKLAEIGALDDATLDLLAGVGERFTIAELDAAMGVHHSGDRARAILADAAHTLHWLASSNYVTSFDPAGDLSERVIFPAGPTESHGMEDVRLVRFVRDDASVVYYGTYTAFDGHQTLPQILETTDFATFRVSTLRGRCAQNKGIALFPRKIEGRFVALGRQDNVNNFLMSTDDVGVWHDKERIQEPKRPWELVQLGNCGSPLETEEGWLVITHGVGPLRQYSLGALLLDLTDPTRVIGHLSEPLLTALGDERDGYVPNVVYSCGSVLHGGHLVVPYGFSDVGASIATVPLADLLDRLTG